MSILIYKNKIMLADGGVLRDSGGGGGSGTTKTETSNIPEYARPYVENMLGATQKQLFKMGPDTTDAEGNVIPGQITGFNEYQPYSANVNDYFAGFSPLQQQAQSQISGMGTPAQFGMGTNLANQGGQNLMGTAAPAMGYGAQGAGIGGLGIAASQQGFGAGQAYEQAATSPGDVARYMSPYMQNVVDYQKSQALRDFQIGQPMMAARAVGQGAFGGNRLALQQSEAQRGLMSQLQGIQATGTQKAFEDAQQAQQYRSNLGLQGLGAGYQGLGLGLQGAQTGLQGVNTAQQGYSGATQSGSTLGNIGAQQSQSDLARIALMNEIGGQMQGFEQGKINQGISNYATAQQYPYMQLGMMSNMLRGLPMQSTTTQSYQNPSAFSQIGGLAATGLGAYGAAGGFRNKKGGAIKVKKYAGNTDGSLVTGGLDVISSAEADLESKSPQELDKIAKTSQSPMLREKAREILAEKIAAQRAQESMGLASAPAPNMDGITTMAGGGIVAFATGKSVKDPTLEMGGEDTVSRYLEKFGYGKPSQEAEMLRAQTTQDREAAKDMQNENFWRSIMMGGAKTMAGTSPNAFANIGAGLEEGLGGYAKGQKDYGDMLNKIRTGEIDIAKLSATDRDRILERAIGASKIEEEQKTRRQNAQIAAAGRAQTAGLAKDDMLFKSMYATNVKSQEGIVKRKLTEEELNDIANNTLVQLENFKQRKPITVGGKGGDKGGDKGGAATSGVKPTTEAEYNNLPKGAHYVDPNGKTRIKG
jgi:hypothetical protein